MFLETKTTDGTVLEYTPAKEITVIKHKSKAPAAILMRETLLVSENPNFFFIFKRAINGLQIFFHILIVQHSKSGLIIAFRPDILTSLSIFSLSL